jgi:hypothetical protein
VVPKNFGVCPTSIARSNEKAKIGISNIINIFFTRVPFDDCLYFLGLV